MAAKKKAAKKRAPRKIKVPVPFTVFIYLLEPCGDQVNEYKGKTLKQCYDALDEDSMGDFESLVDRVNYLLPDTTTVPFYDEHGNYRALNAVKKDVPYKKLLAAVNAHMQDEWNESFYLDE